MRDHYTFRVLVICGVYVIFGLTVGHFLYQSLRCTPNWMSAVEYSYAGAIAVAVYIWFIKTTGREWL